jgi:glycosyltransferase involved in cell wall biosynthesis
MDVLIIYQFCTFGGVERAILNRVQIFRSYGLSIKVSVGYLRDDGALGSFQEYICANGLEDSIEAFILPQGNSFDWSAYDLVSIIDTPQVFDRIAGVKNLFVECHTPYTPNRQYLKSLPENIRGVLVPSEAFRSLLLWEFPKLPPIYIIPNPVSEEFFKELPDNGDWVFSGRPLTYFARLDDLKNFTEAAAIFESLAGEEDVTYLIVGHGAEDETRVKSAMESGLLERTVLKDKIDFGDVPSLVGRVKTQKGIFLSPSKGESFGLSAAEFISAGVPVLLSNIPPHRELVNGDERFLYELGDVPSAKEKLLAIWEEWDALSKVMSFYGFKFRGAAFHSAWVNFLAEFNPDSLITPKP